MNVRAWKRTSERKLKRRLLISRSHSRLRCRTSLNDHSRTTTEPATPPVEGKNSVCLVPGIGRVRARSVTLVASRARVEVLIGTLGPGMAVAEPGWGSGAARGSVSRDPTCCRAAPRYTTTTAAAAAAATRLSSHLFPSFYLSALRSTRSLSLSFRSSNSLIISFLRFKAPRNYLFIHLSFLLPR